MKPRDPQTGRFLRAKQPPVLHRAQPAADKPDQWRAENAADAHRVRTEAAQRAVLEAESEPRRFSVASGYVIVLALAAVAVWAMLALVQEWGL